MPQTVAEQLQSIPMSPNLSQSFGRAQEFAHNQAHRSLLLEHLLLALTEDPEASEVLRACSVDLDRLRTDVSGYLGSLPEDMRATSDAEPGPDGEMLRVIEAARQVAQQSRRREIDGKIVLAAIVGDEKSPAAGLLKTHGMTFNEVIRTLQKASAQARSKHYSGSTAKAASDSVPPTREPTAPPAPERPAAAPLSNNAPAPAAAVGGGQTVDEILAAARARIQQRSAGSSSKPEPPVPEPPLKAQPERAPVSLSSRTAALTPNPPSPELPDPPPRIARQAAAPGLPPMPQGISPAPPLPGVGATAIAEPSLPQPRMPSSRPPEGGGPISQMPPQPRRPDLRTGRPDTAEPTLSARPPGQGGAQAGPQGGPAKGPRRAPPAETSRATGRASPQSRSGARQAAGPLMEAIPRRMRLGAPATAQVRINRDKVESLMQLLAGGRAQPSPDAAIAHALSVRLHAPDGGFAIDPATPETQWVELAPGRPHEDHIGWRWTVTPHLRGRQQLQLLVSARTVSRDGVGPETAPPDRTIDIAVRGSRFKRLFRFAGVLILLGLGMVAGRFSHDKLAQDLFDLASALWTAIHGLLVTSGFVSG